MGSASADGSLPSRASASGARASGRATPDVLTINHSPEAACAPGGGAGDDAEAGAQTEGREWGTELGQKAEAAGADPDGSVMLAKIRRKGE